VTGRRPGASIECDAGRRPSILDSVDSNPLDDCFGAGVIPGSGTFFCLGCGSQLAMRETEKLPECPRCGHSRFRRDSIFEARQDHEHPTGEFQASSDPASSDWLEEARGQLDRPGPHLAMRDDDGAILTFAIERGWTSIGRSATADLRLDDPSVSRRHALVVAEPGKELRVLDDRSLNRVFLNGEPVELETLREGDELAIGRYVLHPVRR
jgi:predicted RNA-binding Zn-ribbon protein involved in translation (DUF1610 family)